MSATVKGELIAADSVMCRVRAGSRDEVLKLAADHLKQAGYVTDGFSRRCLSGKICSPRESASETPAWQFPMRNRDS